MILCPICRPAVRSEFFTRPTALAHAIAIHIAHLKVSTTPDRVEIQARYEASARPCVGTVNETEHPDYQTDSE